MNPVIIFFITTTICLLISGFLLPKFAEGKKGNNFGLGLIFSGICFGIFSFALLAHDIDLLNQIISIGLIFLAIGLLFFLRAGTQHISTASRRFVLILAFIYIVTLAIIRHYFPSNPDFINSGLFLLNPYPLVKFMEVVLLGAILVPASMVMADEIRAVDRPSASIFFLSIQTIWIGLVIMLVSPEDQFIMLTALAMLVAEVLLVLTSFGLFRHHQVRYSIWTVRLFFRNYIAHYLEKLKRINII